MCRSCRWEAQDGGRSGGDEELHPWRNFADVAPAPMLPRETPQIAGPEKIPETHCGINKYIAV